MRRARHFPSRPPPRNSASASIPRLVLSVLSPKYLYICCDQNGPPPRRDEHILHGSVTEEQRRRRAIFIATLRAGGPLAFFRVARSDSIATDTATSLAS